MLFKKKKDLIQKVYGPNKKYYNFNKIMSLGFGKWIKLNNSNIYFYYYIYKDKDNKLIYKCTKTDNGLKVNSSNSYGHQLIYKAFINNNQIIES